MRIEYVGSEQTTLMQVCAKTRSFTPLFDRIVVLKSPRELLQKLFVHKPLLSVYLSVKVVIVII